MTCAREGCPNPMLAAHGNARYCSDACKSAAWRAKTGYRLTGTSNACQTRKSRRSGRQISYRKALEALTTELERLAPEGTTLPDAWARGRAIRILHDALPERQQDAA